MLFTTSDTGAKSRTLSYGIVLRVNTPALRKAEENCRDREHLLHEPPLRVTVPLHYSIAFIVYDLAKANVPMCQ